VLEAIRKLKLKPAEIIFVL